MAVWLTYSSTIIHTLSEKAKIFFCSRPTQGPTEGMWLV